MREEEVQSGRDDAVEGLGYLDAEGPGGNSDGSHSDAGDEAVGLADDDGGEREGPAEDTKLKEGAESCGVEARPERGGAEEGAEAAHLQADGENGDGEGGPEDGGDAAVQGGERGSEDERENAAGDAEGDGGAIALKGALGADADGFQRAGEDDEAGDAERGEAVGCEGSAWLGH